MFEGLVIPPPTDLDPPPFDPRDLGQVEEEEA